jgi:hypothetical protein
MQQRGIEIKYVIEYAKNGKIIEYYESHYPLASSVVLSSQRGQTLGIICKQTIKN